MVYLHTIGNKQDICHNFIGLHLKEMSSGHESVTDKRMEGCTYRTNKLGVLRFLMVCGHRKFMGLTTKGYSFKCIFLASLNTPVQIT